jgi:hypothetical protein
LKKQASERETDRGTDTILGVSDVSQRFSYLYRSAHICFILGNDGVCLCPQPVKDIPANWSERQRAVLRGHIDGYTILTPKRRWSWANRPMVAIRFSVP